MGSSNGLGLFSARFFNVLLLAVSLPGVAAASAPIKFSVNVTSSSVPGFTPISFDQIITIDDLNPNPVVTLYPSAGNLLKSDNGASGVFDPTPFTAALLATVAPINPGGGLYAETGWYQDFSNGAGQVHFQKSSTQFYAAGSVYNYDIYNLELGKQVTPLNAADIQPMTLSRISQLMAGGPLNWSEFASRTVYDAPNGNVIGGTNIYYSGTATFIAVLPEPAMLSTIALAASCLMRRRRV